MIISEIARMCIELAYKRNKLNADYIEAHKKARDYYRQHLLPAENSDTTDNEERDAAYATYDNLRINEALLEKQIDIIDNVINALTEAEEALITAKTEGIWREE